MPHSTTKLCHSSLFSTTKPTCEATWTPGRDNKRTKRATLASSSSVSGLVHAQKRHNQIKFLIAREKKTDMVSDLLEQEEEAKQDKRTALVAALEKRSLLRMQNARINLHGLLLSRRDGN